MKMYTLIDIGGLPYLRIKNPLAGTSLISKAEFDRHEALYIESAKKIIHPVQGKKEYFENEIQVIWRYRETPDSRWVELTSEPSAINTSPEQYEQVFKVITINTDSFQVNVKKWVTETFGEEKASDTKERSFRFFEEAIELIQAFGMTKEEALRVVVYSFNRPPGEPNKEAGDALLTLAALCAAGGLDMPVCGEEVLKYNTEHSAEIKTKHILKIDQKIAI